MEVRIVSLEQILRQTRCGIVDLGLQSLRCDLQEVLIYVLCQKDMFCFPLVLVSMGVKPVYTVCSRHAFDGGQRRQRMRVCVCVCVYMLVLV